MADEDSAGPRQAVKDAALGVEDRGDDALLDRSAREVCECGVAEPHADEVAARVRRKPRDAGDALATRGPLVEADVGREEEATLVLEDRRVDLSLRDRAERGFAGRFVHVGD